MSLKDSIRSVATRLRLYKTMWSGDFRNWEEALLKTESYSSLGIIERVKMAALKVKNGEAVYERDSVLFDRVQYSYPLLSALMFVAAQNRGNIKVMDFGGSLGSSYFQNKLFLDRIVHVEWSILEQESFVTCGRECMQNEILQFFYTPAECITERGLPDILITSCTLPYLEQPYKVLEELLSYKIPYLIIDNTPFNRINENRICRQKVPNYIYEATLPCWLLSYPEIRSSVEKKYHIITEHQNDSFIHVDGYKIYYKGLLGMLKQ